LSNLPSGYLSIPWQSEIMIGILVLQPFADSHKVGTNIESTHGDSTT